MVRGRLKACLQGGLEVVQVQASEKLKLPVQVTGIAAN